MYFASEDTVLVNFKKREALMFDSLGYIVNQTNFNLRKPYKVVAESVQNSKDEKYLLLKDH